MSSRGFTLVELMVAVAIVALLSAMAVPRFSFFMLKARQAEARRNIGHIAALAESYRGDHTEYLEQSNDTMISGQCFQHGLATLGFGLN